MGNYFVRIRDVAPPVTYASNLTQFRLQVKLENIALKYYHSVIYRATMALLCVTWSYLWKECHPHIRSSGWDFCYTMMVIPDMPER